MGVVRLMASVHVSPLLEVERVTHPFLFLTSSAALLTCPTFGL